MDQEIVQSKNNHLQYGNKTKFDSFFSRPYYYQRIPHSNLLLVAIDPMHTSCVRTLSTAPVVIDYEDEFPCNKLYLNHMHRRRIEECFTEHPEV